jgi:hypothetical protein
MLAGNEEWAFSYPKEDDVLEVGDFIAHEFDMQSEGITREGFIYRQSTGLCERESTRVVGIGKHAWLRVVC